MLFPTTLLECQGNLYGKDLRLCGEINRPALASEHLQVPTADKSTSNLDDAT